MGIYDRDYYREKSGFAAFDNRIRACYVLAALYVCVFFLQLLTREAAFVGRNKQISPVTELLELKASKVLDGEVWRLATYSFVHDTDFFLPLVLNILFLVWFGRYVEEIYGWGEFLAYYLLAGLLAGLGFVLSAALGQHDNSILIGPAGAITAILFLFALHFPRRSVLLFFVLPCPIWFVLAFNVLNDVVDFRGKGLHPGALAAHAAAAAFAFLYFQYSLRIMSWLPGLPSRTKRIKARPRLQIFQGEAGDEQVAPTTSSLPVSASMASAHMPAAVNSAAAQAAMDEHLEAKLDKVLEKVKKHGQDSLSDEERAVLFRASEIYRKRRKMGGS